MKMIRTPLILLFSLMFVGCVSLPPSHDYTEFRNADPQSIIVMPPINHTTEVIAPYSLMAQVVTPIAESGFYVFPVAVVDQTFKNNGVTVAQDAQNISFDKLHEIFGADSALYLTIEEYGTSYALISSNTVVTVSGKLVDLRTGVTLWQHQATASSAESRSSGGQGLVGALVEAAANQIIETVSDTGFDIAAITSSRLLSSKGYNGLLHGPRSPQYGQPVPSEKK